VKSIDDVSMKMVPMYAGAFDDINAMASFSQRVKDALLRESILYECIGAGIPLHEVLHRLLILRLEPASLAYSHLQSVLHKVEWRRKHLANQEAMMRFLMKRAYRRWHWRMQNELTTPSAAKCQKAEWISYCDFGQCTRTPLVCCLRLPAACRSTQYPRSSSDLWTRRSTSGSRTGYER
jgi:hypothetical protein